MFFICLNNKLGLKKIHKLKCTSIVASEKKIYM